MPVMLVGENGYTTSAAHTVGESLPSTSALNNLSNPGADYTPVGVMDGIGAYALDNDTVRVFVNHELNNDRGNAYQVSDGDGSSFAMVGARISYIDFDSDTREIVDSGIAYNTIFDRDGEVASSTAFLENDAPGFARFCSSALFEGETFGTNRGIADTIYFTGEEDGGSFNPTGGAEWVLDVETGTFYDVPAFGRGAWENITQLDTGTQTHVAFILSDDTSPFDADDDGDDEAAPLYLYLGEKNSGSGEFLDQNGLENGKLFVWVSDTGETLPSEFNTAGSLAGTWVEVDNAQDAAQASDDGSTGFDSYGYATQRNLWTQAEAAGTFGFSRPEDVSTNPADGSQFVLASTGVDSYDVDPVSGNGSDTFGTVYTMDVDFSDLDNPTGELNILYDGDADPSHALRSPDNVDWADDGHIFVQEDKAEDQSLSGEPLFGPGAANPNEAGIVKIDPDTGDLIRISNIDRSVILDPTTSGTPVDMDAGEAGEWESSGILDVSRLFGTAPGTTFLADIQAHGIEDQTDVNADSRIFDTDLVEGGQLVFIDADALIV
ncbi:MAG: DUF839 domain-containing protein [Hyphomicrobiales bacterium]|nr:DUF839 domain-containing protein [Hyphomicrobiales bacterium]